MPLLLQELEVWWKHEPNGLPGFSFTWEPKVLGMLVGKGIMLQKVCILITFYYLLAMK